MLSVKMYGDEALVLRLTTMSDRLRQALLKKVTELADRLLAHVVRDKLSGQVLNVRTGALRSGIFKEVTQTPTGVKGEVIAPRDVPYAAIHEYGGVINIPEIVPTKAQALHFIMNGQDVFAKRVRAHTVRMPERSYLRSSLDDMKDEIAEELTETVRQVAEEK